MKQDTSTKEVATETNGEEGADIAKVSEEEIEITVFMIERSDAPMHSDLDVVKELSKRTNIKFNWELAPSTNHQEKFNLVMASGELPDVMIYNRADLLKYAEQGAFEPLNDLIDQFAPNLKKKLNENELVLKTVTYSDGNIYVIPQLSAVRVAEVFIIRQDWLDKLGLERPETIDDWYLTMKAFKEQDPNGNGQQDEIPYCVRNGRSNVIPFIFSWGIEEEFFEENGKIVYGAIDPRMKDALAWINKAYTEGLIDPEYLTIDTQQWQARFTNEQSGILHDWGSRVDFFEEAVKSVNPSADFEAIAPPKGPTGIQATTKQMMPVRDGGCAAIASTSKYKEEIMKMYNYIFSEEGQILMNFGIEGVHYTVKDGQYAYTDLIMNNPDYTSPLITLFNFGIVRDWPMQQDIRYENAFASDNLKRAWDIYNPIIKDRLPTLNFTEAEREVLNAKYTEIKTYKDEMLDKFIIGAEPIDKFDDFVAQIKSMGIDEVIKIYEDALARYKAQ